MNILQEWIKDAAQQALASTGVSAKFDFPPTEDAPALEIHLNGGETLLATYCSGLASHQVPAVLSRIRNSIAPGQRPALCVRRLSWSLLDKCRESEVAVFDLEGNAWLRLPGIYIERLRPSREAAPEPSSGTVFTAKASRMARALLRSFPTPLGQVGIVRETGLSAGYVSTLTKRLAAQGYVREGGSVLWLNDPERLLDDWLAHYRFDRHVKNTFAISAGNYDEGVKKLGAALEQAGVDFAWTGWTGAHLRAPYATPTIYTAYVSEIPKKLTSVFPVERDGNVVLYMPHDAGVFQFTTATESGPVVSDAQLYLDLCRMPGRAKEQAEALRHERLDFARKVG